MADKEATMVKPIPIPVTLMVKGTSYRQDVVRRVHEGLSVTAAHDPDNPHDAQAYAVRTLTGDLLGYLPRELTVRLAHPAYDATITEVLDGETIGLRVKLLAPLAAAPSVPSAPDGGDAHPDPVMPSGPPVYSRSGRRLGTLLRRDRHQVHVTTTAGVVPYPADLVEVRQTADA